MLRRIYHSAALAALPSTDTLMARAARTGQKLDTVTAHMEGMMEEHEVRLAKTSRSRRSVLDALRDRANRIRAVIERLIAAIEGFIEAREDAVVEAFDRREAVIIDDIHALQAKLERAAQAREAVTKFVETL